MARRRHDVSPGAPGSGDDAGKGAHEIVVAVAERRGR